MNASNYKQKRERRTARQRNQERNVRTNESCSRVYSRSISTIMSHVIADESVLRIKPSPRTYADILPSHKRTNAVTCIGGGGLPYKKIIIITTSKNGTKSKRILKIRKTKKFGRLDNPVRYR